MNAADRARLHALPKLDLHLHLDGSLRVATARDLARACGQPLPTEDLAELRRHLQVQPDCRSLPEFLAVFDFFMPLLRTPAAIERLAYELCEDCAREHVVYFETRFAPHLVATDGFTPHDAVAAALHGLAQGNRAFGTDSRLILCCCRHLPQHSLAVAKLAAAFRDRGVVGIDLACDEREPAAPHRAAFAHAEQHAVHRTVHAGEAGPPTLIREALDLLHAERIGHAVALQHDRELYARVRDEGIVLELNLTSNLQTCAVPSLATHPCPHYHRDGLRITLNTDDPGVSGITLTGEYALAADAYGFTDRDFHALTATAVDAAFLDDSERRTLRARIDRAWPAA
ncbi:MAG TPA: adenosine deaminase [bacterium]|nr:adenosine deaminase [bacterium]